MAKNPFPGINPYLNSYLLINGGWKTFYSKHITHLTDYLEAILPSNYYTMPEDSLQISAYHPTVEQCVLTGADISVYATYATTNPSQSASPAVKTLSSPTLDIPVIATIFNEDGLC